MSVFSNEVTSVQNAIGEDVFEGSDSDHWTATEFGSGYAYHYEIVDENVAGFVSKSTVKDVRAVRDWVWVDD